MNDDSKIFIVFFVMVLLTISILCFSYYKNNLVRVENFENTIKDLSDEQKCLHICGFEFHNSFENYKFCIEKCDRISERVVKCGETK